MDNSGHIADSSGEKLEYVPVLVVKAIVIREALRIASDHHMDKIMIQSDLQLVINWIRGLIKIRSQIINYVIDIVI